MKRLLLFLLIVIAAAGQQTPADDSKTAGGRAPGNSDSKTTRRVAAPKIERCGLGSKHVCHCLERTDAIHNKIIAACEADGKTARQLDECLRRESARIHRSAISECPKTNPRKLIGRVRRPSRKFAV